MRIINFTIGVILIFIFIFWILYIYFPVLFEAFVPHFSGMIVLGISSLVFIIFLFRLLIIDSLNLDKEVEILRYIKSEVKNVNSQDIDVIAKIESIIHKKNDSKDKKVIEIIQKIIKIRELDSIELSEILEKLLFRFDFLAIRKGLPNIFLLLGILGTIIGLAEAIYSLSVQVSNIGNNVISPKDFYPLLSGTINSMKNAFACSLWGIIFSILSFIIIGNYSKELNKFLNEFREFILFDLSNIVFPKKTAIEFENVSKIIKTSQELLNRYSQYLNEISDIMKQSATDFNNAIKDSILNTKNMIDNLISTSNTVKETLNDTTKNVEKSLSDSVNAISNASEELKKGLVNLIETTQNFRKYYNDLNLTYSNLERIFLESKNHLEETIEKQLKEIKLYEKTIEEKTNKIINKLIDVSKDLHDTQLKFIDYKEEIHNYNKEIRDYIQIPFNDLKDSVKGLLTEYYKSLEGLINGFRDFSQKYSQDFPSKILEITNEFKNLYEQLNTLKEKIDGFNQEIFNLNQKFHKEIKDSIKEINEELLNYNKEILNTIKLSLQEISNNYYTNIKNLFDNRFNIDETAIKDTNNLNLDSLSNFNYNDLLSIFDRLENILKDLNKNLDNYMHLNSKNKVQQNGQFDIPQQSQDIEKILTYINEINNEVKSIKMILENKFNKKLKIPFFRILKMFIYVI